MDAWHPKHVEVYDTIKCLWKWHCIKLVTLLWYIMIHSWQNIEHSWLFWNLRPEIRYVFTLREILGQQWDIEQRLKKQLLPSLTNPVRNLFLEYFCIRNGRMAVEGSGHVSHKSATFSRPLSSVDGHKALKKGSGKEVKLTSRICLSMGQKHTCK
jgi:hypothetical protein